MPSIVELNLPIPTEPSAGPVRRVLLVRAATTLFGLPLSGCREVVSGAGYTPLPCSEPFVRGLINLRGRLVTVIDLAAWAALPPVPLADHSVVVVQFGARHVGLAVSEVVEIVSIDAEAADAGTDDAVTLQRSLPTEDGEVRVFGLLNSDAVFRPVLS